MVDVSSLSPDRQFLEDVKRGLTSIPKFLSSKYFYDEAGDRLFQRIMELEEYYLTRCEHDILSSHKSALLQHFKSECERFHLVEFGAGDGYKTKILLRYFLDRHASFEYNPIDISGNAIQQLVRNLDQSLPNLSVAPMNREYFQALEELNRKSTCRKIILFLGSNIGNFTEPETDEFLSRLAGVVLPEDQLLIGFDLKKDPEIIRAAYNDSQGVTREFNLNLLKRINRELDADFNLGEFYHRPVYDPRSGTALSYLVSCRKQEVNIRAIPVKINFEKEEPIHTEISQKFSLEDIERFARRAGFRIKENFLDGKRYFVNSLWELNIQSN